MNILYITSRAIEINASSSIRNIATIEGLIGIGHQVTVCSMKPDCTGKYYDKRIEKLDIERIYFDSIIKTAAKTANRFNIFQTRLYKIIRRKRLYDSSRQIINHVDDMDISKYDLMISSSDPKTSHLFAERLSEKSKKKIKWIQIWGDPFASDMTISGSKSFMKRVKTEEHRLLSKSDSIIYVSEATLEEQKDNYPDCADKMRYLPIPYMKRNCQYKEENSCKKIVKIAYCGDYLSHIRNIVPLYDAIKGLDGYEIRICGDSDIKLEATDNILISGRIPYQEVCEIEDSSDILVVICNLFGTQIPGKIYQYSGTDKPILFILDGKKEIIKKQFQKYERYDFCNNDSNEIRNKLREIKRMKKCYGPVNVFESKVIAKKILDFS
ncbi:hypothetical protein [Eubacterium sp. An3]|uniref:hypothetical protein n=1 Tax=Eubacterium sp. An3 TaxID=1965628 RepID=UPI000B3A61EF|nr:hypothetical protein [Eubacterium sp. An3]OUO28893.1 hypothetical protein B5F87_06570 [Eubacterium sp. An3]